MNSCFDGQADPIEFVGCYGEWWHDDHDIAKWPNPHTFVECKIANKLSVSPVGWHPCQWTYPDYRRGDYQEFFSRCRQALRR